MIGTSVDTIAAIATPLGEGGIAVVRLSGTNAIPIGDKCFLPVGRNSSRLTEAASHTIQYGHITRGGERVDEVLVAVMRAPRTYTMEDVVEITCHGGILSTKATLDAVLASGARLAEPGEFTRRAFLNGRVDLAQAEAVADLIHARTDLAMRVANEQLGGSLSRRINQLRDQMLGVLAHVEAHIDFPDEDISPDTQEQLRARLEQGIKSIERLLSTADEGRILRRGIRVAIIGRPNAGKSSLLNILAGHERAIVSAIPGTTRDTIEEFTNIRGIPVTFIDTAGLRDAGDTIEREGIRRTREAISRADLILHVFDASLEITPADLDFLEEFAAARRIYIRNKADLPSRLDLPKRLSPVIDVSCVSQSGVEELKDAITQLVWSGRVQTDMSEVMINSRHQDALQRAHNAASKAVESLASNRPLELTALDLRTSVNSIGEIVGKTATEDLLDQIFSQFCIGK